MARKRRSAKRGRPALRKAGRGAAMRVIRKAVRRARKARAGKPFRTRGVLLKFAAPRKRVRKLGAGVKKASEKELKIFKSVHEKSPAGSARTREQDEHVDFGYVKNDIEKVLRLRKGHYSRKIAKAAAMELVKSGIEGLDDILDGGIPKDFLILLSGTCGTGKSIFAMNFLIEGALMGEPGVYISLEESPESNIKQMRLFGWPIDELVKKNKIMLIQPELYNFDALLTTIEDSVDRIKAKRLVIDSASIIGMYFEDPYKVRKTIIQLGTMLKKLGCTTIMIDEIKEGEPSLSAFGVEEFVVDGVIVLYLIKKSNIFIRACVVRKMRGMDHSTKIHPMDIRSPGGIIIYPAQELFEEIT